MSSRLCQYSVNPRTVFLNVRIIWGRGVSYKNSDSCPPTEIENLGKGTGKVYFYLIFQVMLMKSNFQGAAVPWDRKTLSLSTEEKKESVRWG